MADARVQFVDTTLSRPAVACAGDDLLAKVVPSLAAAGFAELDVMSPPSFQGLVSARLDPWSRLRRVRELAGDAKLRARINGQALYGTEHFADDAVELFVNAAAAAGVEVFGAFDQLNDLRNLETLARAVRDAGKRLEIGLLFGSGPAHDARWQDLARRAVELGAAEVVVADVLGAARPAQVAAAVGAVVEAGAWAGVAVYGPAAVAAYTAAAQAGATSFEVAVPPAADGLWAPRVDVVVAALAADGAVDLRRLAPAAAALASLQYPASPPALEAAERGLPPLLVALIAGELTTRGAQDRLQAALDDVEVMVSELGDPPLSPLVVSILAAQAARNVTEESRYLSVTQELKNYLHGLYGTPPSQASEDVRRAVIGRAEAIGARPADLLESPLPAARKAAGDAGDEAVLLHVMAPAAAAEMARERAAAAEAAPAGDDEPAATGAEESGDEAESPAAGAAAPDPEPQPAAPQATTAEFQVEVEGETFTVRVSGAGFAVAPMAAGGGGGAPQPGPAAPRPGGGTAVVAPMQGLIVKLAVKAGDQVKIGDVVAVLEAMKMQNDIVSTATGKVSGVHVREGEVVRPDQPLVSIG